MIALTKAINSDCEEMHNIRLDAFSPLLEIYRDYDGKILQKQLERATPSLLRNAREGDRRSGGGSRAPHGIGVAPPVA